MQPLIPAPPTVEVAGAAADDASDDGVSVADGGGDEEEDDAKGQAPAAAAASSSSAKPTSARWSHKDTVVLLDAVLKYTDAHGKPSKKSSKAPQYPAAWNFIAKEIEGKLGSSKSVVQCHNRFFNLTSLLVVRAHRRVPR